MTQESESEKYFINTKKGGEYVADNKNTLPDRFQ
jgi:hypothetical protein